MSTKQTAVQPIDSLVDYVQQRVGLLVNDLNNMQVPANERDREAYWRKIATSAESIRILAEALEVEARKHL